jgi:alpha-D-ribose 1-methylphosphonate 5-triphosphate synthase subunit PhnH
MSDAALSPGFAAPVADAQATFRAVLAAMASPGSLHRVSAAEALAPPAPLCAAAAACVLTLIDSEVTLWLDARARAAGGWVAFHCGARAAPSRRDAQYALAIGWPGLDDFAPGTDDAPQDGATLIVQVDALDEGAAWRLSGPGLRVPTPLRARGLPSDFAEQWRRNRARFPLGVDVVLCAGATLAALPRSVSLEAC